eukprot:7491649-Lingulodinium_polyedra.AAC.1
MAEAEEVMMWPACRSLATSTAARAPLRAKRRACTAPRVDRRPPASWLRSGERPGTRCATGRA